MWKLPSSKPESALKEVARGSPLGIFLKQAFSSLYENFDLLGTQRRSILEKRRKADANGLC